MIFDVNKNAGIKGVMSVEDVYAWRNKFDWPDFLHIAVQGILMLTSVRFSFFQTWLNSIDDFWCE